MSAPAHVPATLRIFSYQPNPRVWKATIAARLNGVALELRGASPAALADWLWDYDAHPLTAAERADDSLVARGRVGFAGTALRKTRAFLDAHPFGTVPAAFGADGAIGVFESNSILRAVARLGEARLPLYGAHALEASRIDSFLDASLVLARDTQPWLLALRAREYDAARLEHARMACTVYLDGIERTLARDHAWLVGERLSIADIAFACELTMLWYERPHAAPLAERGLAPALPFDIAHSHPRVMAHFARLRAEPAFAADLGPHLAELEHAESALG